MILKKNRKSEFISYFENTPPGIMCPHFWQLKHANGCIYDCAYCYLKLTFRHLKQPVIYSNVGEMAVEIRKWMRENKDPQVLNAGEVCDSLAFDQATNLSRMLIKLFKNQSKHYILFVTKSDYIKNILEFKASDRVIISFSINTLHDSFQFESKAPDVRDRLRAARELLDNGWRVRLRIDPLIPPFTVTEWDKFLKDVPTSYGNESEYYKAGFCIDEWVNDEFCYCKGAKYK